MTIIRKPTAAGLSDPSVVRQAEASLAQSSIIANGKPAVVNSGLVLPSTTITTTNNAVIATTSANNQSADTVTIYETGGSVYVSAIDQTIRKTTINNPIAGVSKIIAGNNVTITSSNGDGTGNVTINSTGGGSGTPGGSNTQIQFNDAGAFGGNTGFTFNKTTGDLNLPDGTILQGDGGGIEYPTSPGYEWDLHSSDGNVYIGSVQDMAYIDTYSPNIGVRLRTTGTNQNDWVFDSDGNLTLPDTGTIWNNGGLTTLQAGNNGAQIGSNDGQSYVIANVDGTYMQTLADTDNYLWHFGTDGNLTTPGVSGNITGANVIEANTVTANTFASPGNLQLVAGEALWTLTDTGSTIFPTISVQRGDNPSGTITGQTLLFGDSTQEAIISTPDGTANINASQRLVINPGAGYANTAGEGGDIYLWAGRGGNASGTGGDIKIRGGQGGDNTAGGSGGDGGYIRIEAGDAANAAAAGYITVVGGNSATIQGGYVEILGGQGATIGGGANLKGGYGTATGGNVNIWGGASGNGQVNEGHVNIQTGGNTWLFDPEGNLTAPGSAYFSGYNMFIGEGSNTLGFVASTLVISADNNAYIQAAVTNVSDIGSADWVAYGHRGNDNGGWVDMGFTSSGFSDANYTITGQGDGYVFVETFVDGQSPGGRGGNLILATGSNGTVNDIIFATNGFALENEFGRISSANNALEFTSAGNITGANVVSANSFVGNGAGLTNLPTPTATTRYIAAGPGGVININTTDNFVLVNRNGQATVNLILPNNASSGQQFTIKESSGASTVLTVSSSDTGNVLVDGQATVTIGANTYNSVTVIMSTDGSGSGNGYWITSQYA